MILECFCSVICSGILIVQKNSVSVNSAAVLQAFTKNFWLWYSKYVNSCCDPKDVWSVMVLVLEHRCLLRYWYQLVVSWPVNPEHLLCCVSTPDPCLSSLFFCNFADQFMSSPYCFPTSFFFSSAPKVLNSWCQIHSGGERSISDNDSSLTLLDMT